MTCLNAWVGWLRRRYFPGNRHMLCIYALSHLRGHLVPIEVGRGSSHAPEVEAHSAASIVEAAEEGLHFCFSSAGSTGCPRMMRFNVTASRIEPELSRIRFPCPRIMRCLCRATPKSGTPCLLATTSKRVAVRVRWPPIMVCVVMISSSTTPGFTARRTR